MSDFDKEAEREKLREQFAEDEHKRESTERMSQLLLQGATMTNRHCDTCGDPLFRYEGQTFCSTCQREIDDHDPEAAVDAQSASEATTETADPPSPTAGTSTDDGRRIVVDDPHDASDSEPGRTDHHDETDPVRTRTSSTDASRRTPPSPAAETDDDAERDTRTAGDLAAVEASLTRTLSRLSSEAEKSDDLGRVREYLAATNEAAEALTAVRHAQR